jgi:hypothetical protein
MRRYTTDAESIETGGRAVVDDFNVLCSEEDMDM